MKHKAKLRGVKVCAIDKQQRPGIARAFLHPTKLNFQLRDTPETKLRFSPAGKTLYGGVQWSIGVVPMRPGIAAPVITAKQDKQMATPAAKREIEKVLAKPGPGGAHLGKGVAKMMAAQKGIAKAEATQSNPKAAKAAAKAAARAEIAKAQAAKAAAEAAGFGHWF